MHSIYLYVIKEKLQNVFIDSYKYSEDLLNKEINYGQNLKDDYQKLFKIICKECNDDDNCYIALPHHYLIMECLKDIFNKKNYYKWLKTPEKKNIL